MTERNAIGAAACVAWLVAALLIIGAWIDRDWDFGFWSALVGFALGGSVPVSIATLVLFVADRWGYD